MQLNKKPVLVTGGAGFIASHLIEFFDQTDIDYIALDNLSGGSIENIPSAIRKNRFILGDVCDFNLMENLIKSSSCVINMASNVGVKNVISNPLDNIETNINSLKHIAESCAINQIPLIFFSTSLAYSHHQEKKELFSEDDQTYALGFHPVSIYVTAKKTGELLCEYYRELMNLKYIIIRPFNIIGIRQRSNSGMVVPSFIESALHSNKINIYGSGNQTRTFSDVKVAVKLLWSLIQKESSYGQIFNLATTDTPITILDLAKIIVKIINEPIEIKFTPIGKIYGQNYRDVEYRSPSLAKLRQHISIWENTDLEQTIKIIIENEKNILINNN